MLYRHQRQQPVGCRPRGQWPRRRERRHALHRHGYLSPPVSAVWAHPDDNRQHFAQEPALRVADDGDPGYGVYLMSMLRSLSGLARTPRRLARDTSGVALLEFAFGMPI